VEALGVHDAPVADSSSEADMNRGAIHVPETPMPWEEREQKNVYIAGHRIGYPDTASRLLFYNLDKLSGGDAVVLKDRDGNEYAYRVTEMFEVGPSDVWVMDTVRDRDIVTLQTCTPVPTFEKRLIVRADRV
jgi:sortase A